MSLLNRSFTLIAISLVALVCNVIGMPAATLAQENPWPLTENMHISESDFTFSMNYPAGWHADEGRLAGESRKVKTITELEEDLQHVLDGTFEFEGYTIVFDSPSIMDLVAYDLPISEATLMDLLDAFGQMYQLQITSDISETDIFLLVPALRVRTVDDVGNALDVIVGYVGELQPFILMLAAPSGNALDAFLPTWEAMLESTQPESLEFPAPSGPYQVGRVSRHWVDETRDEIFTDDTDDHRELIVHIWYPADIETDMTPTQYFQDFAGPMGEEALAEWELGVWKGLDGSDPATQELIQWATHTFPDVPVSGAQESYPVLVFSPGHLDVPEEYYIQIEELASHGYIVVGINHPYYSGVTIFPDGRMVMGTNVRWNNSASRGAAERTCAQDIIFVLDQLAILNNDDPGGAFTGRLDLERIGVFGHSLGGMAGALAGAQDDRIRAVVNEDGQLIPVDYDPTLLRQPYMFFTTSPTARFPSQGPEYTVSVSHFEHSSFTDNPIWPMSTPNIGTIHGTRTVKIVRVYLLAFFNKTLKGEDSGLLDGSSDAYPEVEVQLRNTE